jgi:drug/metabolite transporter (DMT)-like permease
MGILDGISGLMQSFSVNYIPSGTLIILLSQAAIPISMALSKPLLKAKYKIFQYIGAGIVIGGLIVVLVPKFVHPDPTPNDGVTPPPNWLIAVWCLVFVLSCIPMTLSSVYKEKALGETEIDVVYLNGYVAIYQFLLSLLLAVPSAYASGLTVQQLPQNFIDGAKCFAGFNRSVF